MSNIQITADSTCDLPADICEKYGVEIKPLYVVLGEKSYLDTVEIKSEEIYDYVAKNGQLPKTSAGSVDDYLTLFKKHVDAGKSVVHVSLGSGLSSSYQNACIAAGEVGNVRVVDSQSLSTGSGHLDLDAAEMAADGKGMDEIADALIARAPKVRASFVIDQLDYLHKGGRCSSVAMLGANLLKIKPVISVGEAGKMSMTDKPRGQYIKVLEKYAKNQLATEGVNKHRVFVTHTKCDDGIVDTVVNIVKESGIFDEVIETTAGCVITSHCGPNTLGVLFEME